MTCPTCESEMTSLPVAVMDDVPHWLWCPRCGTIKHGETFVRGRVGCAVPALVGETRRVLGQIRTCDTIYQNALSTLAEFTTVESP